MTTTVSPGDDIALGLIAQDLMFLRRLAQGVVAAADRAVVPMYCMHSYICLIVHESHRALQAIAPALAEQLAYGCAAAIERARQSVKLFDDNRKQLSDIGTDFERIIEAHREEFLDNTSLPLARPLEKDLVLWRCRGQVISTSHVANFFLAFSPQQIGNPPALGGELHNVAAELGRYAAAATNVMPWAGESFIDALKTNDLTEKEVRAEKVYRQAFDPALPEGIKAALTGLTCALNVVDVLLTDDANGPSAVTSRSCATSRCTMSCRACTHLPDSTVRGFSPLHGHCWTRSSLPRRACGCSRHTGDSATPSCTTGPSGVFRNNCP